MHLVTRNEDRIIKAPIDHIVINVSDIQYAICVKGRSLAITKPLFIYQAVKDVAGNFYWKQIKADTLLKAVVVETLTDSSDGHM